MKGNITANINWTKVILGALAGIVTVITFSLDRVSFLASLYEHNSAFNYSVIITSLWILGGMNFLGGIKREYTVTITYAVSMILYDVFTNDLPTLLFAGISILALIVGSVLSGIASKLTDTPRVPENSPTKN